MGREAYDYIHSLDASIGAYDDLTVTTIKKVYRKLSLIHHPDKGGDVDTFKRLQSSYETLMELV